MTLELARVILRDLYGRDVHYIHDYGTSVAREAVRTVMNRKSASAEDYEKASAIERTLNSGRRST